MKPNIILATIPSDSHNWNLIYMQLLLEENGFKVINLGACTTFQEVEAACLDVMPRFVVISTVNGHGYIEGKEMIQRIKAIPQMEHVPVFIGGKLSTDKSMSYLHAMELELAGYEKAYYENSDIREFVEQIQQLKFKLSK